jgi:hypothetical protein
VTVSNVGPAPVNNLAVVTPAGMKCSTTSLTVGASTTCSFTTAAALGTQTVPVVLTGISNGSQLASQATAYYSGTVAAAGLSSAGTAASSVAGPALPRSISAGSGGMAADAGFPRTLVAVLGLLGLVLVGCALAIGRRAKLVGRASR